MTTPQRSPGFTTSLRLGIVHSTAEKACTLLIAAAQVVVPYADSFPGPRLERVSPGHLVAVASSAAGQEVVVWRWFDAFVQESAESSVRLWEPAHGSVIATPRRAGRLHRPGGRAYLSAGLPGAQWWVEGPVVDRAELAEVELDAVERFLVDAGVWAMPDGRP